MTLHIPIRWFRYMILLSSLVLVMGLAVACGSAREQAIVREQNQVGDQQSVYTRTQPSPFFNWSLQRHMFIELYRAQNNATVTYSYVISEFNSAIIFECPSIGFPIPGGTSLTNPTQMVSYNTSWGATIGQMEPNGLYPPDTSSGTYIMCLNTNGTVSPVYSENNVLAFTQPMKVENGRLVPSGGTNSVQISVRNSDITTSQPPAAPAATPVPKMKP